jgi:hypothetical protein
VWKELGSQFKDQNQNNHSIRLHKTFLTTVSSHHVEIEHNFVDEHPALCNVMFNLLIKWIHVPQSK